VKAGKQLVVQEYKVKVKVKEKVEQHKLMISQL